MKQIMMLLLIASSSGIPVEAQKSLVDIPEDAAMTFNDLAHKYVHKCEEYDLITEDGYILKLFRIPGDESKPILYIHGAVDSTDSILLRGNSSLAVALTKDNYDVWAINLRGNKYSRRHSTMDPDTDSKFWAYSVHQFGYYDLPTAIDFILKKTKQIQLSAIGYSEGTTTMYVLGATRPEYNDKVKIFISLAPICYLHNVLPFMSIAMDLAPVVNEALIALKQEEVLGSNSSSTAFVNTLCSPTTIGYQLCLLNGLFLMTGSDTKEIESSFLPVILGHFPAGTSRRNLLHLVQIRAKQRFANYDFGMVGNLLHYNSLAAPEYDLSKVTMKVALIAAKNDKISTIKDVNLLRKQLPNVVDYKIIKNKLFNHVDYIWGRSTHKTLYPYMFKLLTKYQ
ncbi:unnamed protein product [Arctia plantaginis]|uniref:Lipase n=1 Tax=Arctia plantaginis TaxID=874455 RepID=A0A8S1BMU3_ARCPL|nr:unnamed protein product [Arctia plantaginis]